MPAIRETIKTLILFFSTAVLYSQADPYLLEEEIEENINQALDLFSNGEYLNAIEILSYVLLVEPTNKRASDLIKSIRELYSMEIDSADETEPDNKFCSLFFYLSAGQR